MAHRVLILGGTTEARELSRRLAERPGLDLVLSLAGRTASPLKHEIQVRSGGFGGVEGLAAYLREERIDLLVDATHPYAARIAANAVRAAALADVPAFKLLRPEWQAVEGDRWTIVSTLDEALAGLGPAPRKVFVALGRQEIEPLAQAPQHSYLIRSIDLVDPPLSLPQAHYILARGPFAEVEERAMLIAHCIDVIIAKNSGGAATYGKLAAARALGIPVMLLRRPALVDGQQVATVDEAITRLDHLLIALSAERGE